MSYFYEEHLQELLKLNILTCELISPLTPGFCQTLGQITTE